MAKYRKKPVIIEAVQFLGDARLIQKFVGEQLSIGLDIDGKTVETIIPTLEGNMRASVGDYIIKGVQGEFYPCKPDIFEQTYEKI